MNLQLKVSEQLEAMLKRRAQEAGVDVQTYVLDSLKSLEQESNSLEAETRELSLLSQAEFSAKLDKIAAIHSNAPSGFDDSRESIYAGRGE